MIKKVVGNVIDVKAEVLINASNGKGWMGGIFGSFFPQKGIAQTIHYADPSIERLAKRVAKSGSLECGDIFLTDSGKLDFPKGILHAVTMKKPGQLSNIKIVEDCLESILRFCEVNEVNSVAIPLLGTGTGKVDQKTVLKLYENKLSSSKTIFIIVSLQKTEND